MVVFTLIGSTTAMNTFAESPVFSKMPFHHKSTTGGKHQTTNSGNTTAAAAKSTKAVTAQTVASVTSPVTAPASTTVSQTPSWQQDFTKQPVGALNTGTWNYELNPDVPGWNNEAEAYTNSTNNVRVVPGTGLIIEARKENYTYPGTTKQYGYTSGRVDTRNSFSFEYGKLEATMKLPKGSGTWPAFWLLSANQVNTSKLNPTDADWAQPRFYAKDGEIDIMEAYGSWAGNIEGTLHSYAKSSSGSIALSDYATAFHAYGIEIRPNQLIWSVDGKPYFTMNQPSTSTDEWPIGGGNKFYPILNLAMGGGQNGGGTIDDSSAPWQLVVQSLKYYPPTN